MIAGRLELDRRDEETQLTPVFFTPDGGARQYLGRALATPAGLQFHDGPLAGTSVGLKTK